MTNAMERAALLAESSEITAAMFDLQRPVVETTEVDPEKRFCNGFFNAAPLTSPARGWCSA
jgi:hypothetical protein